MLAAHPRQQPRQRQRRQQQQQQQQQHQQRQRLHHQPLAFRAMLAVLFFQAIARHSVSAAPSKLTPLPEQQQQQRRAPAIRTFETYATPVRLARQIDPVSDSLLSEVFNIGTVDPDVEPTVSAVQPTSSTFASEESLSFSDPTSSLPSATSVADDPSTILTTTESILSTSLTSSVTTEQPQGSSTSTTCTDTTTSVPSGSTAGAESTDNETTTTIDPSSTTESDGDSEPSVETISDDSTSDLSSSAAESITDVKSSSTSESSTEYPWSPASESDTPSSSTSPWYGVGTPSTTSDDITSGITGILSKSFTSTTVEPISQTSPSPRGSRSSTTSSSSSSSLEVQDEATEEEQAAGSESSAGDNQLGGKTSSHSTTARGASRTSNPTDSNHIQDQELDPSSDRDKLPEPSAILFTSSLTYTSEGKTWIVGPYTSTYVTTLPNGERVTTEAVYETRSQFSSSQDTFEPNQKPGVEQDPEGGNTGPFFSHPASAAGVFIAAAVVIASFIWIIVLLLRHRATMKRQEHLEQVGSTDHLPRTASATPHTAFGNSRRQSWQSEGGMADWHARARAELQAMEERGNHPVTLTTGHPTSSGRSTPDSRSSSPYLPQPNLHPDPSQPTLIPAQEPRRLSVIQEDENSMYSPFSDKYAALPASPLMTPNSSVPLTIMVPPAQAFVNRRHEAGMSPTPSSNALGSPLTPLARTQPLRIRPRASSVSSPDQPVSPTSGLPAITPMMRTSSGPGTSRLRQPLLKRTPTPETSSASSNAAANRRFSNPFEEPPTADSNNSSAEALENPFADAETPTDEMTPCASEEDSSSSYFSRDSQRTLSQSLQPKEIPQFHPTVEQRSQPTLRASRGEFGNAV